LGEVGVFEQAGDVSIEQRDPQLVLDYFPLKKKSVCSRKIRSRNWKIVVSSSMSSPSASRITSGRTMFGFFGSGTIWTQLHISSSSGRASSKSSELSACRP